MRFCRDRQLAELGALFAAVGGTELTIINLTGAFMVAQACASEMVKAGAGKIINIASLSGQRGGHGRAAYGSGVR